MIEALAAGLAEIIIGRWLSYLISDISLYLTL